jgi:hypothetical protein
VTSNRQLQPANPLSVFGVGHFGPKIVLLLWTWGVPIRDGGQMEEPRYVDINGAELREIGTELGHPVTKKLAQWFIRNQAAA